MAGVEEELWNIFTFYTLRGNPLDLTRLSVRYVIRILHTSLSNDWCGWITLPTHLVALNRTSVRAWTVYAANANIYGMQSAFLGANRGYFA